MLSASYEVNWNLRNVRADIMLAARDYGMEDQRGCGSDERCMTDLSQSIDPIYGPRIFLIRLK